MNNWPTLKPLVVVTGKLSVHQHEGTKPTPRDRDAGNILVKHFNRQLERISALTTPYGVCVSKTRLKDVLQLFAQTEKDISAFNKVPKRPCFIDSSLLWETLEGSRRAAVEGWLFSHPEVAATDALVAAQPSAAALAADASVEGLHAARGLVAAAGPAHAAGELDPAALGRASGVNSGTG